MSVSANGGVTLFQKRSLECSTYSNIPYAGVVTLQGVLLDSSRKDSLQPCQEALAER